MKVLLADDEISTVDKYSSHLRRKYTNVYSAYDGLSAYRVYKQMNPDVIILDLHLPQLSGLELLKRIRKEDKKTIIVILSAFSEKNMIEEALMNHVYKYVIKPISRSELKEVLEKIEIEILKGEL